MFAWTVAFSGGLDLPGYPISLIGCQQGCESEQKVVEN
jgi:hypothetical protein